MVVQFLVPDSFHHKGYPTSKHPDDADSNVSNNRNSFRIETVVRTLKADVLDASPLMVSHLTQEKLQSSLNGKLHVNSCSHTTRPTMRLQGVFIAVITTLLSIAAADTLQKWTDIASKAKSNVIRLDHETFDQIVGTDRNYTAISINLQKCICTQLLTEVF